MAIAPPVKKKVGTPTPPIYNAPQNVDPAQPQAPGPDGSPEVVAAQQALLSKTRGRPQFAKSDPRYGRDANPRRQMPMPGMNQRPRGDMNTIQAMPMPFTTGGKPPQGGNSLDVNPQLGIMRPDEMRMTSMTGKPSAGMGGRQVPGGVAIGGPKPQLDMGDNAWRGGPRSAPPMQGGASEGGQPDSFPPFRQMDQPRPGMEFRPRGGQRPVGGGMQGAPQDGGMQQFNPQQQMDDYNNAINNMSPEIRAQYDQLQGSMPSMASAGQGGWANQQSQGQMDPRQQYFKQLSGMQ